MRETEKKSEREREGEREREDISGVGAEREGERISISFHTVSAEPDSGPDLMNREIMI